MFIQNSWHSLLTLSREIELYTRTLRLTFTHLWRNALNKPFFKKDEWAANYMHPSDLSCSNLGEWYAFIIYLISKEKFQIFML